MDAIWLSPYSEMGVGKLAALVESGEGSEACKMGENANAKKISAMPPGNRSRGRFFVGRASRLPWKDLRTQARRPSHISKFQANWAANISAVLKMNAFMEKLGFENQTKIDSFFDWLRISESRGYRAHFFRSNRHWRVPYIWNGHFPSGLDRAKTP